MGPCYRKHFDSFVWKIPNISSVPHEVNYFVQSPSFSWGGESFILKMYPYGQIVFSSEGYIDVIIERQHYHTNAQTVSVCVFCVDIFNKKVNSGRHCEFRLKEKQNNILLFMRSLKDNPESWKLTPNNTFTLVCAIKHGTISGLPIEEQDFQALLNEQYIGGRIENLNNTGVGEIYREVYESLYFIMYVIGPVLPEGYQIQQKFPFANAMWLLKIYPYFKMISSNEPSFDLVLERLQSKVSEHHFNLQISFTDNKIEQIGERFFMFNSHHKISDVINFRFKENSNGVMCLKTELIFRMKIDKGLEPNLHLKSKLVKVDARHPESFKVLQNNKFLGDFRKLFLQKEDSDVTIKVKRQEFPAHKIILIARSPVLAATFQSDKYP